MANGVEDTTIFTWIYGAIASIGVLGMAAVGFLYRRISEGDDHLWAAHREHVTKTDEMENDAKDSQLENEKRFALKDDIKDLKAHMDKKFDDLGNLVIDVIKQRKP